MKRMLVKTGLVAALAFPGWGTVHAIDALTTADAIAIKAVVQSQLEALSNDDAASAFALATPEKRMLIGTPDNFLRLIKEEYNPIYRYQRVMLSRPEVVDGDAIQLVRVTDSNSRVWVAVFWMLQDDEGNWRIDGCQLLETTSVSV